PDLQKGLTREALQQRLPAGPARNAIDCALWSLEAAQQQKSLTSLLGVAVPESIVTAQTVVIGEPEQMAASAKALYDAGATLLKVKLDARLISERKLSARSDVPKAPLLVDAEEAWHTQGLGARSRLLGDLEV
ncbi:L-Ala-D/L-Glu epimerase, partial [Enterobacter cloacae]|nr:L-Ala-D/L-Glu epimerase [Enterobacter cloacae]